MSLTAFRASATPNSLQKGVVGIQVSNKPFSFTQKQGGRNLKKLMISSFMTLCFLLIILGPALAAQIDFQSVSRAGPKTGSARAVKI